MQRYEKYKDSGIDWLGEIPEHWGEVKLKNFFKNSGSKFIDGDWIESKDIGGDDIYYFTTGNIQELKFREGDKTFITYNTFKKINCTEVLDGDILISRLNLPLGRCCIFKSYDKKTIVSVDVVICRPDGEFNRKYLIYVMNSPMYFLNTENIARGAIMKRISRTMLGNIKFPIPSPQEQKNIAHFLDEKCEKIDAAVILKEQQIEKLKELRQITIHNAVTKGVRYFKGEIVPTKYSGIDWIGEIPKYWEVKANRIIFIERNENGDDSLPLLSVSIHSAVSKDEIDEDLNIKGRIKIEDKSKYKLVRSDDIVFNMMRAWQGAIGQVSNDGMVSPAYIVAKPMIPINSMFIEYLFRTKGYIESMNRASKGITDFRKRLYWDQFKALETVVPPPSEQEEIVAYLEEQTTKIDKAIVQKQEQILKLKEYKQSLINEVVTGKIKITA